MPAASSQRALFLDRDGIINLDHGYVHTRENFELVEGIGEVLQHFSRAGYLLIIVTNQAGIARGYYTEDEFLQFDAWMRADLHSRFDVLITRTYHAPHHPDGVVECFRGESELRKPNPGMLLAAERDFAVSLRNSILLGDKESDIEAGKRAGVGLTILFSPSDVQVPSRADRVIGRLADAITCA